MNKQSGMTMVELIVAVAVTGVIVVFLGTAIYQIFSVSDYGNGRITAMNDLQNAAYWLNADGQGASDAAGGSQLVMTLPDNSTVTYSLAGTDLIRTGGGSQLTLARNITSLSFTVSNRVITMNIVSSPAAAGDVSQSGSYLVGLRPAGGGQ